MKLLMVKPLYAGIRSLNESLSRYILFRVPKKEELSPFARSLYRFLIKMIKVEIYLDDVIAY
jgi:hypothetical protein